MGAIRLPETALALVVAGTGAAQGQTAAQPQTVDLTPLLQVERRVTASPARSAVGGYVQFWVTRTIPSAAEIVRMDRYAAERRGWIERFFIGRNTTRLLSARLIVNRPNAVTQAVTLASASHESSRRVGESWSSETGDERMLTPLVRIEDGMSVSFEVSVHTSARVDADVTRHVISVLERGAQAVTGSGALLATSLTSPRLTRAADFVDSSISRLFGEAILERSLNDLRVERWHAGDDRGMLSVTAFFPMGRHLWDRDRTSSVGQWVLAASEPRVSIFSTEPLHSDGELRSDHRCAMSPAQPAANGREAQAATPLLGHDRQACLAFAGLMPSRVMGYVVGENRTLGQSLRAAESVTAALQHANDVNGGTNRAKGTAARQVCVAITEHAESLGLNGFDSAAALWAFASSGGLDAAISARIWEGDCAAAALARRLHLQLNVRAAEPDEPAATNPPSGEQPARPESGVSPSGA